MFKSTEHFAFFLFFSLPKPLDVIKTKHCDISEGKCQEFQTSRNVISIEGEKPERRFETFIPKDPFALIVTTGIAHNLL